MLIPYLYQYGYLENKNQLRLYFIHTTKKRDKKKKKIFQNLYVCWKLITLYLSISLF